MRFTEVILDADICIKLGRFEKIPILRDILPLIADKIYIYRYVYENEVLTPDSARRQLDELHKLGLLEIVSESNLPPLDLAIFKTIKDKLIWAMVGTTEEGKNWGEVLSLTFAKMKGIPIIMSDESKLQSLIDRYLNIGAGNSQITVFRVKNLIEWIRDNPECGIKRSYAKGIWLALDSRKTIENFDRYGQRKLQWKVIFRVNILTPQMNLTLHRDN